ncbi:VanZ like family protein [Andreprevotia lacus DSM 23236]|jgi:VanZ family protein|uniref:VanZ like family protein n=1 Tax=Andreprevotia lacus DSM 23236 TaxID=1121001 RepID=A0A1W1X1L1_9NEIS|nr:VanZ family protein [Andreprevotia lacus]SMC17832.1 VanZ like family protein [Andreprevotia lacus DSM 23236]
MRAFPPIAYLARDVAPSRVSRFFLACYLLLVLVVSFYPFTGWRFTGEPVFAFYTYPLPYYFTLFDNLVNVLAYIPIGTAVALSVWPRSLSWLLGALAGTVLSCGVEFVQQFIPGRVASNMDILSNGFGALIGGVLALLLSSRRWQRRWQILRYSHLREGSAVEWGVVWLVLWFVTQFDPTVPFLGVVVEARGLPQPFDSPIANAELFLRLLEGGGMMLQMIGVALFVATLMRHAREIPAAIRITLLVGLLVKLAFAGMLLQPAQFFSWINRNIIVGGVAGALLLWGLWRLQWRLRAFLGVLSLAAAAAVSWAWPLTPQMSATLPLFRWHYGHLMHFSGLAAVIGDLWPYGAILILLRMLWPRQQGQL